MRFLINLLIAAEYLMTAQIIIESSRCILVSEVTYSPMKHARSRPIIKIIQNYNA